MLRMMWMSMLLEALPAISCGAVVGVALGLTGGGGSIFAVPLLIYVLDVAPADAVAVSLVAVATTAFVGATQCLRHKLVVWQPTLLFVLGGVLGAPAGSSMARQAEPIWLIVGFALLAIIVGALMLRASFTHPGQASAVRAQPYGAGAGPICTLAPDGQLRFSAPCATVLALIGVGTGFLAGLLGVGGGFLIVPALVFVTRMGVHRAVATSLLIISVIGFAGATGAIWQSHVEWGVLAPFAVGGAVMMIVMRSLATRLAGPILQRTFAGSIIVVGAAMLLESFL
jgi:hypothetical protein